MKQLIPIALASVLAIACSDDGNLSSANDVERVYHVHDTTYIDTFTITDTLVLTSVDTLVINNTDTSIITHTDTNYITKVDTQYITKHDTIYVEDDEDEVVVVHDTIKQMVYDTIYNTLFDTLYIADETSGFDLMNTTYKFEFYKYCVSGNIQTLCSTPVFTTQCYTYGDSITFSAKNTDGYYRSYRTIRQFSWVNAGSNNARQSATNEDAIISNLIKYGVSDFEGSKFYYDASGFNPCQGSWNNECNGVKVRLCD